MGVLVSVQVEIVSASNSMRIVHVTTHLAMTNVIALIIDEIASAWLNCYLFTKFHEVQI